MHHLSSLVAYVALSRCSSLEGLRVVGFSKSKIRADPRVVKFHREIGDTLPSTDQVHECLCFALVAVYAVMCSQT